MVDNLEWLDQALCREVDPELFFPTGNGKDIARISAQAKRICSHCRVSADCFTFALDNEFVLFGIWAGMHASEIRKAATRNKGQRQRKAAG
jgi:WhiB family redox-sensing transcriptional regulator